MLCAFEPVKYCSAAPRDSGGDQPQVGLICLPQQHARLGVAEAEDALHLLVAGEVVEQLGRRAGGQDVDVAAGLGAAAQAADDVVGGVGGRLAQPGDERLGGLAGVGRAGGGRRAASARRWRQDQLFLLRAHPLDAAERAGLGGRFEVVDRGDRSACGRAAPPSSARCPAGASRRGSSAGNTCSSSSRRRRCRSWRCRGCARRGPCRCRRCASSAGTSRSATRAGGVGDDLRAGPVGTDAGRGSRPSARAGRRSRRARGRRRVFHGRMYRSSAVDARTLADARPLGRCRTSERGGASMRGLRTLESPRMSLRDIRRPRRPAADQRLRRADHAAGDARDRARVRPGRAHHLLAQRRGAGAGRRARAGRRGAAQGDAALVQRRPGGRAGRSG